MGDQFTAVDVPTNPDRWNSSACPRENCSPAWPTCPPCGRPSMRHGGSFVLVLRRWGHSLQRACRHPGREQSGAVLQTITRSILPSENGWAPSRGRDARRPYQPRADATAHRRTERRLRPGAASDHAGKQRRDRSDAGEFHPGASAGCWCPVDLPINVNRVLNSVTSTAALERGSGHQLSTERCAPHQSAHDR